MNFDPDFDLVQQAFRRFHFVYGIVNSKGLVYVGYSKNPWHRIGQHNRDAGAVATKGKGPWFPFCIYCFASEQDARNMEMCIDKNFIDYKNQTETSLIEVLVQMGVPMNLNQVTLIK